jgi:hypothetical protein
VNMKTRSIFFQIPNLTQKLAGTQAATQGIMHFFSATVALDSFATSSLLLYSMYGGGGTVPTF